MTFGKIEEMDATGGRVAGRAIMSLAAEKGIIWTQESRVCIGGGGSGGIRMRADRVGKDWPEVRKGVAGEIAHCAKHVKHAKLMSETGSTLGL